MISRRLNVFFLRGDSQRITSPVQPGYVHIRYGAYELGCGLYKERYLYSQIPKSLRTTIAVDDL